MQTASFLTLERRFLTQRPAARGRQTTPPGPIRSELGARSYFQESFAFTRIHSEMTAIRGVMAIKRNRERRLAGGSRFNWKTSPPRRNPRLDIGLNLIGRRASGIGTHRTFN